MVNNTVVDNELGGTDISVQVEWRKLKESLMCGKWNPSEWMTTADAELCTVRWGGAYLCALGKDWLGKSPYAANSEKLSTFLRVADFRLTALRFVTFNVGEGEADENINSLSEIIGNMGYSTITLDKAGGYETQLENFNVYTCDSYALQFDNLGSSYPLLNKWEDNRDKVAVRLLNSVLLAKQVGFEN